jgi:tyrosine decarboxylase / aspartate 1-decarboxylase
MELETKSLPLLARAIEKMGEGFESLPNLDDSVDYEAVEKVLLLAAERMQDNYPYMHPNYAGQMLKPPHPVARLAYSMALFVNPNNHALDGGRASSAMEKEAVAEIAGMFGFKKHLGHLTGGGTMANLEALWVASQLRPGKYIVASKQAHYTHSRITGVLGIKYKSIDVDDRNRMSLKHLEDELASGEVGTVVVTLGTTSTGSVDPLPQILKLRNKYDFRIHIDAAYGGYFRLVDNLESDALAAYAALEHADSIVVDPHKHGLQPYGCGCVIFADPACGALYKHDSPYTYFSSDQLHLGEISLECSRAGASAVALWTTQKLLPLVKEGKFARGLSQSREAAVALSQKLESDSRFALPFKPQLDIVVWAVQATSIEESSQMARAIFENAAKHDLHLALATLPASLFKGVWKEPVADDAMVMCLRSCLMKPEHLEQLEHIWALIEKSIPATIGIN